MRRKQFFPAPPSAHFSKGGHLFSVLSEPTRLRLLECLRAEPQTVSELIDACGIKQANASKHLGILYEACLVKRDREGNAIRYRLTAPWVFNLCDLVLDKLRSDAKSDAASLGCS